MPREPCAAKTWCSQSLADELMQVPPVAVGSTTDSYKTFGGDETRNRILAVTGTPGAHSIASHSPNQP